MEKVFIKIYNQNGVYITEQDVSGFTAKQTAENMRIKEKHGLVCYIKRVFYNNEVS